MLHRLYHLEGGERVKLGWTIFLGELLHASSREAANLKLIGSHVAGAVNRKQLCQAPSYHSGGQTGKNYLCLTYVHQCCEGKVQ